MRFSAKIVGRLGALVNKVLIGYFSTAFLSLASPILAQDSAEPNNPSTGNVLAPAPQLVARADAPLVKSLNMKLPLEQGEHLAPYDDGCAEINISHSWSENKGWRWYGACPFGVVHGSGYVRGQDGKFYRQKFTYGFRIKFNINLNNFDIFQSNYTNNFPLTIVAKNSKSGLNIKLSESIFLYEYKKYNENIISHSLGIGNFFCPYKGITEPFSIADNTYKKAAKTACREMKRQKSGASSKPNPEYVALSSNVLLPDLKSAPSSETAPNPVIKKIRICSIVNGASDCSAQVQELLAPYRERIENVISNDRKAQDAARAMFVARFKPLEDAFAERGRRLAPKMRMQTPEPASASPQTVIAKPVVASF